MSLNQFKKPPLYEERHQVATNYDIKCSDLICGGWWFWHILIFLIWFLIFWLRPIPVITVCYWVKLIQTCSLLQLLWAPSCAWQVSFSLNDLFPIDLVTPKRRTMETVAVLLLSSSFFLFLSFRLTWRFYLFLPLYKSIKAPHVLSGTCALLYFATTLK